MIILKNILVPTDFGPASQAALSYGCNLADTFAATVHVLHVMDNSLFQARFADPAIIEAATREQLNDQVAAIEVQRLSTNVVIEKFDSPTDSILRYAKSARIDLIVMGTHGRKGAAHVLLGSVAEQIVRSAPCPVLVVRSPEREFITDIDQSASMSA